MSNFYRSDSLIESSISREEKSFDHITEAHVTELCNPLFAFKEVCATHLLAAHIRHTVSALDYVEHWGVTCVDWWASFSEPVALPHPHGGRLSRGLLGLWSPQIQFLNEDPTREETRQPYTSQTLVTLKFTQTPTSK